MEENDIEEKEWEKLKECRKKLKKEYRYFYFNNGMFNRLIYIIEEIVNLEPEQFNSLTDCKRLVDIFKQYKIYHDEMMSE